METVEPIIPKSNGEIIFENKKNIKRVPKNYEMDKYFNELTKKFRFNSLYGSFSQQKEKKEDFNGERGISHHAQDLKACVDYIWYSGPSYKVNTILELPDPAYLNCLPHSAPVDYFPSDHFCLVTDLKLKKDQ